MNKFTMELVWHNCKTYPPKEFKNNNLIATNGTEVFGLSWHRAEGYFIAKGHKFVPIKLLDLPNWWWADIEQTVQGESKFRGLIIDDLVGI